ncbi:hypothetical protein BZZ03_10500 [Lactococcus petauri]|uniref:Uncharacterized protein n=2 Tax=Lactococcus petauri TaxID=1940789 RepID=A0A252CAL7_9LACT|nr:hypothetical protein BZZ03_10500 [Lactococcus petauri]
MGALLLSFVFTASLLKMTYLLYFLYSPEQKLAMLIIVIIHITLGWIIFFKIDASPKKGWAIFSLVYGIFILLAGLGATLSNPLNGIIRIISGIALIAAFVFKTSQQNRISQ